MRLHNRIRGALLAAGLAAALLVSACGGKADKQVVATYKDGKVTQSEFNTFVNTVSFFNPMYASFKDDPEFNDAMLKQLIGLRFLAAKADADVRKEAENKAKEQVGQIREMFNSQDKNGFKNQLKESKLTEKDIQSYIESSFSAIMAEEKQITDKDIRATYDTALKENKYAFDTVSVAHILIGLKDQSGKDLRTKEEALKRAQEVIDKLKKGGDFAALAKEYSDDPGSKDNGGRYENEEIGTVQWVEPFKKAASELPVGQLSDPVETQFGYHVMKVDKRTTKTFDELKESLRSETAGKRLGDFMEKEVPGLIVSTNLPKAEAPKDEKTETPAAK